MFDTMTMTKILGAGCGALLLFLLGGFGAEKIYHMGGHGHGEEHVQGYKIEVAEAGGEEEEDVPQRDFLEVFASADPAKGERVWSKCRTCHKLEDGANGTGPHLYSVVDRSIGAVDGYGYSEVLASSDEAWTAENLDGFLENPRGWAPGTKMSFNGLDDVEDRANLIAYLATFGG